MCEDSILRMNANFSCLELVSLSNIHSTPFSTVSLCVICVESIPHTITIDNRALRSIIGRAERAHLVDLSARFFGIYIYIYLKVTINCGY